jgi:hypothetical protein
LMKEEKGDLLVESYNILNLLLCYWMCIVSVMLGR